MKLVTICIAMAALWIPLTVFADDPPVVSICDIQQYNGVMQGDRVQVTGVCIAETGRFGSQNTVISQEGGGPWCAIWVYVTNSELEAVVGDCVTVVGTVNEYYDKTELNVSDTETIRPVVSSDCFPVPPAVWSFTEAAGTEPNESCLVEIWCSTATTDPDSFGVFSIDDGSGATNALFSSSWAQPAAGDFFCFMRGIMDYSWNTFRLRPRTEEDFDKTTPSEECMFCDTTPTPTPVQSPTDTPLPTNSPTPTATRTTAPTRTPTPVQPTATPTPTIPSNTDCEVDLILNGTVFQASDHFLLTLTITPIATTFTNNLFVILDVYSQYFFYPNWTQDLNFEPLVNLNQPRTDTILDFYWPENAGSADDLMFYAATTDEAIVNLRSNLDTVTFGFN